MRNIIAAAFAAAMLLAGCTALPGGARITAGDYTAGSVAFHGLLEADNGIAGAEPAARYIFMVHGMGDTRPDYSEPLMDRLRDQGYVRSDAQDWTGTRLNAPISVRGEAMTCVDPTVPPCRFDAFGQYRTDTFVKGRQKVVLYTYYWHADLHRIQAPFLAADRQERRSRWIQTLKQDTIVMGFGDAAAYLGPAGSLVRQGIGVGLCAMLRDAAQRPVVVEDGTVACDLNQLTADDARRYGQAEYGFVTMSLGSRMLFDTLEDHASASTAVLPVLARRTRYFYMLANQLPLLGLGRLEVASIPLAGNTDASDTGVGMPFFRPACDRSGGFLSYAGCERSQAGLTSDGSGPPPVSDTLDVVAFRDPEDLLGFAASTGMAEFGPSVRFIEVWNRNAPVYLGLIADPRKTHAAELEHEASARLIVCGARAMEGGSLAPLTCR